MKKLKLFALFIFLISMLFLSYKLVEKKNIKNESNVTNNENIENIDDNEENEDVITDEESESDEEVVEEIVNDEIEEVEEVEEINEFISIITYKEENKDRYIAYKEKYNNLSNEEIVKRVNVYLDYNFYEHDIDAINKQTPLVLVNKFFYLDENYVPENLVKINIDYASNSSLYAVSEAVEHFEEMCSAAKEQGLTIKAMSTYRSYSSQKSIYERYLKTDTVENVDSYSARAGHSEHQSGYVFDVYNTKVSFTDFGSTNEFTWVKENSYKYGFIIRYTEENSYITGYTSEPWHLRYVGIDAATYIYNNNITLEEYLLNKK